MGEGGEELRIKRRIIDNMKIFISGKKEKNSIMSQLWVLPISVENFNYFCFIFHYIHCIMQMKLFFVLLSVAIVKKNQSRVQIFFPTKFKKKTQNS